MSGELCTTSTSVVGVSGVSAVRVLCEGHALAVTLRGSNDGGGTSFGLAKSVKAWYCWGASSDNVLRRVGAVAILATSWWETDRLKGPEGVVVLL
jgi:hypothetical protein